MKGSVSNWKNADADPSTVDHRSSTVQLILHVQKHKRRCYKRRLSKICVVFLKSEFFAGADSVLIGHDAIQLNTVKTLWEHQIRC